MKALKTGEQATVSLDTVAQSLSDLLFEDEIAEEHGEQLPPLVQRLTAR